MNRIIILLLTTLLVCLVLMSACENSQNKKLIYSEDSLIISENRDSLERERIFESLGDTVFGSVRYGQNKKQTESDIIKFQEQLKHGKYFIFGGIDFEDMSQNVTNYESIPKTDVSWGSFLDYPVIYKDKLTSISWISTYLSDSGINTLDEKLRNFVKLFEKKYGKPSMPYSQSNWWNESYQNGTKLYCLGGQVAEWESSKRKILIYMETSGWPKETYAALSYRIHVRFINKVLQDELSIYQKSIEEVNEAEKSKIKNKENAKYENAL